MIFRNIIALLLLVLCTVSAGKKSFVLVIDTTRSMNDEITFLKNRLSFVARSIKMTGDIVDYILLPFNDPDVGTPLISSTPEGLVNFLSEIETKGETDCPENSLTAVEKALEISKNNSKIFLFTDAPAKDFDKLQSIQTLCSQRKSQVVTFLSGECSDQVHNNIAAYFELSKACAGSVFHMDITSMRYLKPFQYMREMINVDWTNINTHKEFMGSKQFNFDVDAYTKDLVVAVSGDSPIVRISDELDNNPTMSTIMETRRSLVIRLLQPVHGQYIADIRSRGETLVTFYKLKELSFKYGFSPKKPRSLKETSCKPLPDVTSYLIIELADSNIELYLVEQQTGDDKETLDFEILDENKGLYMASSFFAGAKGFRISIHGREKSTNEGIRGLTAIITPQEMAFDRRSPIKASIELVDPISTLVDFMSNATLFCKVNGIPKPDVWWEDDAGNKIESEDDLLNIPSVYISYATVENATRNSTIHCKCKNELGNDSATIELYVHREFSFEVIQYPSDTTIEYRSEGKLNCEVQAYPEATLKWYHNDSEVDSIGNIQIVPEDNALVIKNMTLDETGEYKCEMMNEVERKTYIAIVDISGLESPSIEITKSEYILKPGDWVEVECKILKGNPAPEVVWKKVVDNFEPDKIPDGVYVDGNLLKIPSASSEHSGSYKCEAMNLQGEDSKEVEVKVYYAPKIKSSEEVKTVRYGESVKLECNVDAVPKANVHWDLYQDDVIIAFDNRHYTDAQNAHHFIAQLQDSGIYHCIAENNMGRVQKSVTVNVLVAPYIEHLEYSTLTVRSGGSVSLTCNVSSGYPIPSTRWEFISPRSTVIVLTRNVTTKLDLVLRNITKKDEGTYQCVTENEVGLDDIRVVLRVQN